MYLRMHVNDHKFKIWGLENVNIYTHTKSAISVFLQKSARLKCDIKLLQQFNKQ